MTENEGNEKKVTVEVAPGNGAGKSNGQSPNAKSENTDGTIFDDALEPFKREGVSS